MSHLTVITNKCLRLAQPQYCTTQHDQFIHYHWALLGNPQTKWYLATVSHLTTAHHQEWHPILLGSKYEYICETSLSAGSTMFLLQFDIQQICYMSIKHSCAVWDPDCIYCTYILVSFIQSAPNAAFQCYKS